MFASADASIALRARRALLPESLHWREYLIEAGALAAFMLSACTVSLLLDYPVSPAHAALPDPFARRALTGLLMGLTLILIVHSPWGRRSGAQMNPAVTLTFLRLGRIARHDALGYVFAQFAGGVLGVLFARRLFGGPLGHPTVHYVATRPGMTGALAALIAELAISALLMTMILETGRSPRWKRFTGVFAGALVALYITFEAPLSGMSMNAARTVGSAVVAQDWTAVWVYLVAPLAGMLLAAELFLRRHGTGDIPCGKLSHGDPCLFCEHVATRRADGTIPADLSL